MLWSGAIAFYLGRCHSGCDIEEFGSPQKKGSGTIPDLASHAWSAIISVEPRVLCPLAFFTVEPLHIMRVIEHFQPRPIQTLFL